jgi:hypothetical protein
MAYTPDPNVQKSIIRQSMLKAAVDYSSGCNYSITEVIGIALAFSEFAEHGTWEIAKQVETKLQK